MFRILTTWSGFPGAPGITAFHFSGDDSVSQVDGARTAVRDLWYDLRGEFPGGLMFTVEENAEVFDAGTGELLDVVTSSLGALTVSATGTGTWAAPAGASVTWKTAGIHSGRRVRGRTFLVPLKGSAFATDGTLDPFTLSAIRDAVDAFAVTATLSVWARPRPGIPGAVYGINSATVNDRVAVLRSRRD